MRIKRIDLPEESLVLRSVYERMRSERKQVADALRAEGNEAAAAHPRERRSRGAGAEGRSVRATPRRRAARAMRRRPRSTPSAYGRDPEFYAFYRSLEAYRESLTTQNGVLVLDPKSEFLRYLQESK